MDGQRCPLKRRDLKRGVLSPGGCQAELYRPFYMSVLGHSNRERPYIFTWSKEYILLLNFVNYIKVIILVNTHNQK